MKWIKIVGETPTYETPGAVGADIRAAHDVSIMAGTLGIVCTGLSLEVPNGLAAIICPRSGLSANDRIIMIPAIGIIDTDYRGEIKVPLFNAGEHLHKIKTGDRVAQLVIVPYERCIFVPVDKLTETERGKRGFGSTGR